MDVGELYTTYGPMVLRRCRALLHDEDLALEATQDTFVRILRARESLHDGAPSSLLYRTATNVCLNRLRTMRRKPQDPMDDLICKLAQYEDPEERSLVNQLLKKLFSQEKATTATIAVLHYVDGLTLDEVARVVHMSQSGVRRRLTALRARVTGLEDYNDK